LAKQDECRAARVNRVEIDLTRAGSREEIMPWLASVKQPHPTYLAGVWRAVRGAAIEVHLLPLDKPLKSIRIPLRPADKDVVLDLQPLVEQAYHRGRYGNLDYAPVLEPPLTGPEAAIAERVLAQARNR
jgi:hypothetical protein